MHDEKARQPPIVPMAIVFEGGLGLLAIALGWLFAAQPLDHLVFRWADAGWGVLATLPLALVFWACLRAPFRPLIRLKRTVLRLVRQLFAEGSIWELAAVAAAAGVGEELLFRGFIQPMAAERLGPMGGLILASLLFGLAHAISRTYAVLAGLIGLYLGGLWMMTENLMAPMVAHGMYDFLALVYLIRKVRRSQ